MKTLLMSLILLLLNTSCGNTDSFKSLEETKALLNNLPEPTKAFALSKVTNRQAVTEEQVSVDVNNEDTGDDTDTTYTCAYDKVADGTVTTGTDCGSLPSHSKASFDAATGKLEWVPEGDTGSFEFKITGKTTKQSADSLFVVTVTLNRKPKLSRILDQSIYSGDPLAVTAQDTRNSTGTEFSCTFDSTVDGSVASGKSCRDLPGLPAIKFDTGSGLLTWQPDAQSYGKYEVQITGTNTFGTDAKIFVVEVKSTSSSLLRLTYVRDQTLIVGESFTVDLNNEVTGSDAGVTYTCTFDYSVDGVVTDSTSCNSFLGSPANKFNTASGVLTFTPTQNPGVDAEVKIVAVKGTATDTRYFAMSFAAQRFGEVGNSAIVFTPPSWDFGALAVNTAATDKTVTLKNNATAPIYMGSYYITSDNYQLKWSACPSGNTPLRPQETCLISVGFKPTSSAQIGASLEVHFGKATNTNSDFTSILGLSGRGVGALTFAGLASISNVTHNSMRLNWASTPEALSFMIYQIDGGGAATLYETISNGSGTVTSKTYSGLTPNTAYTWRVRAIDVMGIPDNNVVNRSATTSVNHQPKIGSAPAGTWLVETGHVVPALDFNSIDAATNGYDIDSDGDGIRYTCYYDTTVDSTVGNGLGTCESLTNLGGGHPTFNIYTGVFSGWKPALADVGVTYEFEIVASDFPYQSSSATDSVVRFSKIVSAGTPFITSISNKTFPSSYLTAGVNLSLDFDNIKYLTATPAESASDTDMSYSCTYVSKLPGVTSSSANCSTLPGTASFGTTNGQLSWTPPAAAQASTYTLTVTGTNAIGTHSRTFSADVVPPNQKFSNALIQLDAQFIDKIAPDPNGAGTTFTNTWKDLAATASDSTLNNYVNNPWVGDGTATNPAALTFDGTDDYVSATSSWSSNATVGFNTWVYPTSSSAEKVLFTFGDNTAKGITLTNKRLYQGDGSNTYTTSVKAEKDTDGSGSLPVMYFDFTYNGTTAVTDRSTATRNLTIAGTGLVQQGVEDGVGRLTDNGVNVPNGAYMYFNGNKYTPGSANYSLESWFYYPLPDQCRGNSWCSLVRSQTGADYHVRVCNHNSTAAVNLNANTNNSATHSNCNLGMYLGATFNNQWYSTGYSMYGLSTGWHHLAVVSKSSPAATTYYIDGVQAGVPIAATALAATDFYYVGANATNQAFGIIDEFAIWPGQLSATQIQNHYKKGRNGCSYSLWNNAWTNIAGKDADGGTIDLFVNGAKICSLSKTLQSTMAGSVNDLNIGRSSVGPSNSYFAGKVSQFGLFSSQSDTEVTSNYTATKSRYTLPDLPKTGLKFWVRADQGMYQGITAATTAATADGHPVGLWQDLSGNSGDLVAPSTACVYTSGVNGSTTPECHRPILKTNVLNGKPVLAFDGRDDFLRNNVQYNLPNTTFVVSRINNTNHPDSPAVAAGRVFSAQSSNWILGFHSGRTDCYYVNAMSGGSPSTGWVTQGGVYTTGQWRIFSGDQSHSATGVTSNRLFVNGNLDYNSTAILGSTGLWGVALGGYGSGNGSEFSTAEVAEVIVYTRVLTDAERDAVFSYLNARYAVY